VEEDDDALGVYLNDQYTSFQNALELARRARDGATDPERRATWQDILEESETDHEILEKMLQSLRFGRSRAEALFARAADATARFRPRGRSSRLAGPADLGQLFELEMMFLSVTRKLFLWMNLAAADYPRLRKFDLDELIARAESQRDRLDDHRIELSFRVFGRAGTVV
jgi:hypothetical protein